MVDETPEIRPRHELVFWAILFQISNLALAGLFIGTVVRRSYEVEPLLFVILFFAAPFLGLAIVLYCSLFFRLRTAITTDRMWVLPTLFGLILFLLGLGLPETFPVILIAVPFFAMVLRLVHLDLQWQRELIQHDVPPCKGFSLWDLMMGFVGISIVLATVRLIMSAPGY